MINIRPENHIYTPSVPSLYETKRELIAIPLLLFFFLNLSQLLDFFFPLFGSGMHTFEAEFLCKFLLGWQVKLILHKVKD